MKKGFYILVLIGCVLNLLFTVSCNKNPTYEELKSAERKVIRRIIAEKGIEVLDEYPANGVFKENQFVELSSGIYLNVIDSGNGNRAEVSSSGATNVLVRVSGELYWDPIDTFNTFRNGYDAFSFKYGYAYSTAMQNSAPYNSYYMYFGSGLESILAYVGENAEVKLLVPGYSEINDYPAGSSVQSASMYEFIPIYYDRVKYTFY